MPGWRAELGSIGWTVERLTAALEAARTEVGLPAPLSEQKVEDLAAEVLHVDGDLMAKHKVFTRTHLVTAIAPLLYGHDPAELDRVVDTILGGHHVVPLLGSGAVHERAYATVEVLATEQAIADSIERLTRQPGPALPEPDITDAAVAKGREIGRSLTPGQWDVVEAVCGSGRAVEVIIGVAGSGKTTALDAATTALDRAGYRVVGTSTSGQAARTLGAEAHIESRTIASLLWRLNNHQIVLDHRTVLILDEAAMTADRELHRVIDHVEQARAKLVLVGDPRQLSSIGPGGALAALLERHPEVLTTLSQNVRQRDPAERRALAQLRNGNVHKAIDWYLGRGRTSLNANRTDALIAMTDTWARDIAEGHDTALLAWRRDDVRDLNRLARQHMHRSGRLSGPHLVAPGGRAYAAGDQAVVLAPLPDHGLVTCQRITITRAHPQDHALEAKTTDGRRILLTGAAIDAEHLDHGYAVTVHRAQGATYDRAHVLAAGGGRELAYVALSRARNHTTLHAIADDLPQLRQDLATDWTNPTHQRWITDTAQPGEPAGEQRSEPDDIESTLNQDAARIIKRLDALQARHASRSIDDDFGLGL